MDIGLKLPPELEQATREMVATAIKSAIAEARNKNNFPPYMTQQEASKYLHVSPGTFNKWQRIYNIPVVQIEGVKRYKRTSLDNFMDTIEK